jgi:hypothetical protein
MLIIALADNQHNQFIELYQQQITQVNAWRHAYSIAVNRNT